MLDASHLREHTDVQSVRALMLASGLEVLALERRPLWFPLLDPYLLRFGHRYPGLLTRQPLLRALRAPKVPIPGYYSLEAILER